TILLGDGTARFAPAPASPLDIGYRGGQVLLADYNRDGHPDLATGTSGNNVVVFLGDGRGGFRAAPGSPYAVGRGPWRLATADLNRDGKLDLITANFDSHNVTVLLGR
ncbi:MAG: VCBS repeat-containing protein, partial [Acidobacteria bacterium]|nr:VCBS repeat-containing protein [Acidobacteriota bacterium]